MKIYAMYDMKNNEQCVGIFNNLKEIAKFINNSNLRSLSSAISHKKKLKNRYEVKILEVIMEDKIEVGEYVRNESGYIHKVDSFDKLTNFFKDEDGKLKEWVGENVFGDTISEIIVKHSKNLIDLIEVGDIVELVDVLSQEVIYIWDKEMLEAVKQDIKEGQTLKSILTKEQFESVKYEV